MLLFFQVDLLAEGYAPKEEILSVLKVPPGKMGQVIGRRGASILSVKESCEYVFIICPKSIAPLKLPFD